MAVWFSPASHGTPDGLPIGPSQAALLRHVWQHLGCSLNEASRAGGYGIVGRTRGAYRLQHRGLLGIDRRCPRRYRLTISEAGVEALRAHAAHRT